MKKAKRSGAGKKDIEHFQKQLDEYSFLFWLNPFIRLRGNTKTNLPTEDSTPDSSDDESDLRMEEDDLSESDSVVVKAENMLSKVKEKDATLPKKQPASDQRPQIQKQQKRKSTMRLNNSEETTENDVLQAIQKRLTTNTKVRDEDDIFGEMVAAELRSLPKRLRHRLKHDINNSIFKYQDLQEQENEKVYNPPFQTPNQTFNVIGSTHQAQSNVQPFNYYSTPPQMSAAAASTSSW